VCNLAATSQHASIERRWLADGVNTEGVLLLLHWNSADHVSQLLHPLSQPFQHLFLLCIKVVWCCVLAAGRTHTCNACGDWRVRCKTWLRSGAVHGQKHCVDSRKRPYPGLVELQRLAAVAAATLPTGPTVCVVTMHFDTCQEESMLLLCVHRGRREGQR
jgi:hypothetical protein